MVGISGISATQAKIDCVFVGYGPQHLRLDVRAEDEIVERIFLLELNIVVVLKSKAGATPPGSRPELQVIVTERRSRAASRCRRFRTGKRHANWFLRPSCVTETKEQQHDGKSDKVCPPARRIFLDPAPHKF